MWERLKTDRRIQFAVGLAVVLVLAKWLFTGSLFYAAVDVQRVPADGQTSAGVTVSALLPLVVDLVVGVLVSIGLWIMNAGEWLFGRVRSDMQASAHPQSPLHADTSQVASSPPVPSVLVGLQGLNQEIVLDLGRAALSNDQEKLELIRWQLRKPQAIKELAEAYDQGDADTVQARKAELDAMLGVATKQARKGGASNGK